MAQTAILIVNGGRDPAAGRWLALCLEMVRANTPQSDYHLYVWNNNVDDLWVAEFTAAFPNLTLLNADPLEVLAHKHAVPLQRLYEQARADGRRIIVAMDSDAHPVRSGWLAELVAALDGGAVLAGVWRDELRAGIRPYVHASCLATTTDFIEENGLRLDFIAPKKDARHDTLSNFTDKALALNRPMHRWQRSNANNVHRLIGGVYGDYIYHHGAGSRPGAQFWDEGRSRTAYRENKRIRDLSSELLFHHYEPYMAWLRGLDRPNFVFILGMHRSGTSCLAGALERCGLFLGDVNRANKYNLRGNHELKQAVQLHRQILEASGGSWSAPPAEIVLSDEHQQAMSDIVAALERPVEGAAAPAGLKTPDALLLMDAWLALVSDFALVGTFRHPVAVAQSLQRRNEMPAEEAYALWLAYNRRLLALHERFELPIIEFDLTDAEAYCQAVAALALKMGLPADIEALRHFVSDKLDHSDLSDATVPAECREMYVHLQALCYRPDPAEAGFMARMLQLNAGQESRSSLRQEAMETLFFLAQYLPRPLTQRGRRLLRPLLHKLRS